MTAFELIQESLRNRPRTWLVTGAAGFIGSHLVETLLLLGQRVTGLDNFSLGKQANLDEIQAAVSQEQWSRFAFVKGDIRDAAACRQVCKGAEFVLHQAALGSVPRSIQQPLLYHENNVTGHFNMLLAARDERVHRFVYASSSAVYGDHPALPKKESEIGNPLSPYAAAKRVAEIYSTVINRTYGLETIGLRYFNVFGPRQDPQGAYAAVIPKWVSSLLAGETIYINGSGETSRDFCYVRNAVQANLLAALVEEKPAVNEVYNVAVNRRTSLNELFLLLRDRLAIHHPSLAQAKPLHREFREGDVLHSQADISKAERLLGYHATHDVARGLEEALLWYRKTAGSLTKIKPSPS